MTRLRKVATLYPAYLKDGKTKTMFILGGESTNDPYASMSPELALYNLNQRNCYGTHLSGDLELFGIDSGDKMPFYELHYHINLSDMLFTMFFFE